MTDIEQLLAEIEAGLEGVTPGPWGEVHERNPVQDNFAHSIYGEGFKGLLIARCNQNGSHDADTHHIARLSPDNMQRILDHIRQIKRDLKTVLEREAATTARYDARIEAIERERDEARTKALEEAESIAYRTQPNGTNFDDEWGDWEYAAHDTARAIGDAIGDLINKDTAP